MSEERIKQIVAGVFKAIDVDPAWCDFFVAQPYKVQLDGDFTLRELQAIAAALKTLQVVAEQENLHPETAGLYDIVPLIPEPILPTYAELTDGKPITLPSTEPIA